MEKLRTDALSPLFPKRESEDNKYSVGTALMAVGSRYMTGAAVLAAKGALNMGVGLLCLASEKEALPVIQGHLLEPVFCELGISQLEAMEKKANAALFGCGVEINGHNEGILEYIFNETDIPTVLDASALTMLSQRKDLYKKLSGRFVLTPHEGEMARLSELSAQEIRKDRLAVALEFSRCYGCTLVLKGKNTLVCSQGRVFENPTGNPGMAKGGYGDLLSGMILALLSRGVAPFEAASLGVYLHGLAGDIATERYGEDGALPSKAAECICDAIAKLKRK